MTIQSFLFLLTFLWGGFFNSFAWLLGGPKTVYMFNRMTSLCMLFVTGTRLNIIEDKAGLHRNPRKRKYLFISNHQSQIDIPLMIRTLPVPFSFMAKKELFWTPLLGFHLFAMGSLPVNRGKIHKSYKDLRRAIRVLKDKRSILVFPEGTRSPEDGLLPFKKGYLRMAKEAEVQIVPIVMRGSNSVMPKGSLKIRPGHTVNSLIGEPVDVQNRNQEEIHAQIMDFFNKGYERLKKLPS